MNKLLKEITITVLLLILVLSIPLLLWLFYYLTHCLDSSIEIVIELLGIYLIGGFILHLIYSRGGGKDYGKIKQKGRKS